MYEYKIERKKIFTEEGQRTFLEIRDKVHELLKKSGAFTMGSAINNLCGSSWTHLACVDRLVELGEIREIPQEDVAGQDRVFVKN